jgi:hypothetical protein
MHASRPRKDFTPPPLPRGPLLPVQKCYLLRCKFWAVFIRSDFAVRLATLYDICDLEAYNFVTVPIVRVYTCM